MKYKARSHGAAGRGEYESCTEHLAMTGVLAGAFAADLGMREEGLAAGLLHDLGKYSHEFQHHITHPDDEGKVDHSTYGARVAAARNMGMAAFAIAGHHAGLPEMGTQADTARDSTLAGRLKRTVPDASAGDSVLPAGVLDAASEIDGAYAHAAQAERDFFPYLFRTRMLFSCLVDADRLDAEYFVNGDVGREESSLVEQVHQALGPERLANEEELDSAELIEAAAKASEMIHQRCNETLQLIGQRIEDCNAALLGEPNKSPLDELRCRLLRKCHDAASRERGLFTLTAPTGSGKTNASLTFAVRHACVNHMKRVIYVIPYMSIIDQTVADFEGRLGAENVLPHYSEADYWSRDESDMSMTDLRRTFAAENWDAPVVVTTAVQFFESLFSDRPSKCRKLHNIADSVIVFDEAQTLPASFLCPCCKAIRELCDNYGCSAVMCTATQPELQGVFDSVAGTAVEITELLGLTRDETNAFARTTVIVVGERSMDEVVDRMQSREQALCVVNTRREAADLYDALSERLGSDDGVYCLTTLLCAYDRQRILGKIRRRLADGAPCRVVSTSLIEAGVDVDFPFAMREEAGLDSILQTAGRCNREGRRPKEDSLVEVFSLPLRLPSYIRQNVDAFRGTAASHSADIASADAVHDYFTRLLTLRGDDALDGKRILEKSAKGGSGGFLFRTIANDFRIIDDAGQVTVYVRRDETSCSLCQKLLDGDSLTRAEYRQLGRYSVRLYATAAATLLESGGLSPVGENVFVLTDNALYDVWEGLRLGERDKEGVFF